MIDTCSHSEINDNFKVNKIQKLNDEWIKDLSPTPCKMASIKKHKHCKSEDRTTTTITTTVLRPFVRDYLGEPLPEETFTHSHLSWSSTILYQLPPSTTAR